MFKLLLQEVMFYVHQSLNEVKTALVKNALSMFISS